MASTELEKRKREEYEMQLFGFHSRAVYASLKNIVKNTIQTRCRRLSEAVEEKFCLDEKEKAVLKSNIKELKQMYSQQAEPYLKSIQNIVEKYIAVPSNILLKEDKCQAIQYSDEEFEELNNKLENLQNKLKRAEMLSAALDKELEATSGIQEFEDCANKVFSAIEKGFKYPKPDQDILQSIERYQILNNILECIVPKTQRQIYNPNLSRIQLKEYNHDEY